MSKAKTLHDLTWADLEAWAGQKIVARGMSYQESGLARDLAVTREGSLIAWVRGTKKYATMVSVKKGRPSSICTCPYGTACKHAVAVILEYLDLLQKNAEISPAEEDDQRIALLEDASLVLEDEEGGEFFEEDEPIAAADDLAPFLKKKSKKELEAMLVGILKDHPEIKKELEFTTQKPEEKDCAALIKAITKAIVVTGSEQGWRDYWNHTGHTPNYAPVRKGLKQLLDEGYPDEVVRLGEKLFVKGTEQVGESNDEGETADEIARTMPIVFQALAKCSLSDLDKLERAVDFGLRDEYGLCQGLDEFKQRRFEKKTWSDLADRLLTRLKDMKSRGEGDLFYRNYERDRLSDAVIFALEHAGREDEAFSVCFQEAETTDSYERLVRKLRKAGRITEAEEWICKGVKATQAKWAGIASSLKAELSAIRQRKGDWLFVAALRADDYFNHPGLSTFNDLQKACEKAKVWQEVRDAALKFLETGAYPGSRLGWPLPDTGFGKPGSSRRDKPPFTNALIDIAIKEKRVNDIVKWYEAHKQRSGAWQDVHLEGAVAAAVVHHYPERSIAIWEKIAEGFIAQTNVAAYSEALTYLKKVQKALEGLGRAAEWAAYLTSVAETNRRKSRLVQMLNVLSRRPILSK